MLLLLIWVLVFPVSAEDYGKTIKSEARYTGKTIKKEAKKISDTITKTEPRELPVWYPNPDGSKLYFPLKKEDCFMVGGKPSLTSWYGLVRSDTNGQPYRAINIPAKPNAPVYSIADGVVLATGDARYFRPGRRPYTGMFIEVVSKSGLVVSYEHLNNWKVKEGDIVIAGDQLGTVGGSGRTTGFHLRLLAIYKGQLICISDIRQNFFGLEEARGIKGNIWHCIEPGDLENVSIK